MPLTADQAAEVAARHKLGLADAQALSLLADSVEHADRLAQQFAPQQTPDEMADAVEARRGY